MMGDYFTLVIYRHFGNLYVLSKSVIETCRLIFNGGHENDLNTLLGMADQKQVFIAISSFTSAVPQQGAFRLGRMDNQEARPPLPLRELWDLVELNTNRWLGNGPRLPRSVGERRSSSKSGFDLQGSCSFHAGGRDKKFRAHRSVQPPN